MLSRTVSSGASSVHLYTILSGAQPMVTINAANREEAREALCTLLGDVGALTIRAATAGEALCWNVSAREARSSAHPHAGQPTSAGLSVDHGIGDRPMAKIVLDQPRVRPFLSQRKAARVPKLVRVNLER
jgi:hypothetical protein